MARAFLTVAEELLGVADALCSYFEEAGYSIKIEDSSRIDYPYLPTLRCKRGSTSLLVEIVDSIPPLKRLKEWRAYCSAQQRDTRFALAVSVDVALSMSDLSRIEGERIGLYTVDDTYVVREICNPHDLALGLELPSLTDYPNRVRKVLGPAWEELRRGNWHEGFDSACIALETEVRRYVKRHVGSGRLQFQTAAGNRRVLDDRKIDKMTMGQLKDLLESATTPTHSDSALHGILANLNPDRILVAHRRLESRAEKRLRQKVPGHLWSIVRGVEQAVR